MGIYEKDFLVSSSLFTHPHIPVRGAFGAPVNPNWKKSK